MVFAETREQQGQAIIHQEGTGTGTPPDATFEHVWRYFALHSGQRLAMFNYFTILFGFAGAGLAGCLRAEGALRLAGMGLGIALTFVSFTFWKLDQRTSFLIKHAELALQQLETSVFHDGIRLFSNEVEQSDVTRKVTHPVRRMWTYGESFRLVFMAGALVGLAGAGLSFALFNGWLK
jgi:hypothetical protein